MVSPGLAAIFLLFGMSKGTRTNIRHGRPALSDDYFDIPKGYIAKGWGGYCEDEVKAKLRESEKYSSASSFFSAEAFPDFESLGNGKYAAGYFICCTLKENSQA